MTTTAMFLSSFHLSPLTISEIALLVSKTGLAKPVLLSGRILQIKRNMSLDIGMGVLLTPISIPGSRDMLLWRLEGEMSTMNRHSFLGVTKGEVIM